MKNYNDAATSTVTGTSTTSHSDTSSDVMMVAVDSAMHEFRKRRQERLKMETGYVMMAADGLAIAMVPKQVN